MANDKTNIALPPGVNGFGEPPVSALLSPMPQPPVQATPPTPSTSSPAPAPAQTTKR